MIKKSLVIWLAMGVVAILNAGVRNTFITPRLGEHAGHVISTVTGCSVFLLLIWLALPWIRPASRRDLWLIGSLWLAMTVAFEFLAGHYLFGNSWERLFADYNVLRGRVWVAVLAVTFFGPAWMGRLRGIR
ncbi:MAG: hypothetical protein MUF59_10205 [Candidatus Krumholzibacteria bacterium]|nr:hypothetical protein [Candidatus Krumholzibacteria bacterium]